MYNTDEQKIHNYMCYTEMNTNNNDDTTICSLCGELMPTWILSIKGDDNNYCIICDMDIFLHGENIKHKIGRDYCHYCYSDTKLPPADSVTSQYRKTRTYHPHCYKKFKESDSTLEDDLNPQTNLNEDILLSLDNIGIVDIFNYLRDGTYPPFHRINN